MLAPVALYVAALEAPPLMAYVMEVMADAPASCDAPKLNAEAWPTPGVDGAAGNNKETQRSSERSQAYTVSVSQAGRRHAGLLLPGHVPSVSAPQTGAVSTANVVVLVHETPWLSVAVKTSVYVPMEGGV